MTIVMLVSSTESTGMCLPRAGLIEASYNSGTFFLSVIPILL